MQFICEAYTDGGPVAILRYEHRFLWDGNEDYFHVINQPRNGCLQVLDGFKNTCPLCIYHQESDGNFHVYADRGAFLVIGEISADEGFEIRHCLPSVTQAIRGKPVILDSFGGKIIVFDAAIPGSAIGLRKAGCAQVQFGTKARSFRYDAALIDVDTGNWEALELYCKEDHLSFSGVVFRLVSQ